MPLNMVQQVWIASIRHDCRFGWRKSTMDIFAEAIRSRLTERIRRATGSSLLVPCKASTRCKVSSRESGWMTNEVPRPTPPLYAMCTRVAIRP